MGGGISGGLAPFRPLQRRLQYFFDSRKIAQLMQARHDFGLPYAVLSATQRLVEDQLLAIEGKRGTLGPAHLRHHGNSPAENRNYWSSWDWSAAGEEWTESPEWKASLVDEVLAPTMTGGTLLEIGPGAGRWTEALLERSDRLLVVDVSQTALDLCRERFGGSAPIEYILTEGSSLTGVADASLDGIWSFDVFVHVAPTEVAHYLGEIARGLRPGALAVIHHAGRREPRAWRSPMTAKLFRNLAEERGLAVQRQFDSWGDGRFSVPPFGDVITVLRAPEE